MTEEVMTKETVTTPELTDTLTSEEKSKALQLAQTLDVATSDSVLTYGADAQKNLSAFSQGVLDKVQNQDVGPIGDSLTELMNTLNQASPDDLRPEKQGFFARIFNRVQKSVYEMTAKYQQIGAQVDNVAARLDRHKDSLLADNKMLDGLFQENLDFFNQLNVYIGGAMSVNVNCQLPKKRHAKRTINLMCKRFKIWCNLNNVWKSVPTI